MHTKENWQILEPISSAFSLYRVKARCQVKQMVIEVKQSNEVCLLRCEGRFVAGMDPEYLRRKRNEIKGLNCKRVLVDFSEVSDIGSAGIGFIVGVYMSVRDSGGRFVLTGLRPRVREIFDVTRVSTVIPLAADISSGLAMLCDENHGQKRNAPPGMKLQL